MKIVAETVQSEAFAHSLLDKIRRFLSHCGLPDALQGRYDPWIYTVIVAFAALAAMCILRFFASQLCAKLRHRKKGTLSHEIADSQLIARLLWTLPPLVVLIMLQLAFTHLSPALQFVERLCAIAVVSITVWAINTLITAIWNVISAKGDLRNRPMKGMIQIIRGLLAGFWVIVSVSILIERSPMALITGLGAFAAVGVALCLGLLFSAIGYIVLVVAGRKQYMTALSMFREMQDMLDAKVDLQAERDYSVDVAPLTEIAAVIDGIVSRNSARPAPELDLTAGEESEEPGKGDAPGESEEGAEPASTAEEETAAEEAPEGEASGEETPLEEVAEEDGIVVLPPLSEESGDAVSPEEGGAVPLDETSESGDAGEAGFSPLGRYGGGLVCELTPLELAAEAAENDAHRSPTSEEINREYEVAMFGRKKKHAQFNTMDDSRVTVYDFKRRIQCLFESYRSTDYRLYSGLSEEEMKPKIDRHLEALFAGDVDDGNGDMLDNIIFGPYRESVPYLNIQRLNHKDMNRRLVARRVSDRADFEKIRNERQNELERLEQEYEDVCSKMATVEEG